MVDYMKLIFIGSIAMGLWLLFIQVLLLGVTSLTDCTGPIGAIGTFIGVCLK